MTASFERRKRYFNKMKSLSFSLIYSDDSSLNLIAPSEEAFRQWFFGIKFLLGRIRLQKDYIEATERFNRTKFDNYDLDHNGKLSLKELTQLITSIGIHKPAFAIKYAMKRISQGDHEDLTYNDFCEVMNIIRRRLDLEYMWRQIVLAKPLFTNHPPTLGAFTGVPTGAIEADDEFLSKTISIAEFMEFWRSTQGQSLTLSEAVAMLRDVRDSSRSWGSTAHPDQSSEAGRESGARSIVGNLVSNFYAPGRNRASSPSLNRSAVSADSSPDTTNVTYQEWMAVILHKSNDAFRSDMQRIYQDMTRPLSHYFIASSHNTYLEGDQFQSHSSVNRYIDDLCSNCRCVEIDCWDGDDGQPIVYHGHTLTSKIKFEDVVQAIKNHAFKTTSYPIILSIENHCSHGQQNRMAEIFTRIFGKLLATDRDFDFASNGDGDRKLPSPDMLQNKIIIKGKRQVGEDDVEDEWDDDVNDIDALPLDVESGGDYVKLSNISPTLDRPKTVAGEHAFISPAAHLAYDHRRSSSIFGSFALTKSFRGGSKRKNVSRHSSISTESTTVREGAFSATVNKALSDITLLGGVSSRKFKGFSDSFQSDCFLVSSFKESHMMKFVERDSDNWMAYNTNHMSRIYPNGRRIDSSNFDPFPAWTVGAQLVALNYQTPSLQMQLNHGKFRDNGGCGYVLKPEYMMDSVASAPKPIRLSVNVISGQNIVRSISMARDAPLSPYVMLDIHGVKEDYRQEKTAVVASNGFNPIWDQGFTFDIQNPELAQLTIRVYIEDSVFAGYCSIPIRCLQSGLRTVQLLDEKSTMQGDFAYSSLLIYSAFNAVGKLENDEAVSSTDTQLEVLETGLTRDQMNDD